MKNLSENQIKKIKNFIFKTGRLLERRLYSYFFENGNKDEVIKALIAYQNLDGGFGNGIEPDLLCPDSTAIGAETAMYILDLLDINNGNVVNNLTNWIFKVQNSEGYINHPPENLLHYPFQPWWKNPDDQRILVIAAILKKWGYNNNQFFKKVNNFFLKAKAPEDIQIYNYPYFVYLKYCSKDDKEKKKLVEFIQTLPKFFEEHRNHYPLFSRYWFYFIDDIKEEVIKNELEFFKSGIQEDGGLKIVFEDLPWWRPIFTLDGLILQKKFKIIDF